MRRRPSWLKVAAACRELAPHLGGDRLAAVLYRAGWPDQQIIAGTLADIRAKVRAAKITRTAPILVGCVLSADAFDDSRLYAPDHVHVPRPKRGKQGCRALLSVRRLKVVPFGITWGILARCQQEGDQWGCRF